MRYIKIYFYLDVNKVTLTFHFEKNLSRIEKLVDVYMLEAIQ